MQEQEIHLHVEPYKSKKRDKVVLGQWLGAVLEAEGSIKFDKVATQVRAWPTIRISNTDSAFLELIRTFLKMNDLNIFENKHDRSKSLVFSRERALQVMELVRLYTPSKSRLFEYFDLWKKTKTGIEKYEIALSYGYEKSVSDKRALHIRYDSLIAHPAFVAGLIDSRGSHFKSEPSSRQGTREGLRFYSKKPNLIEALKRRFQGSGPIKHAGSHYWSVEGDAYLNLLMLISPYLEIPIETAKRGGNIKREHQ